MANRDRSRSLNRRTMRDRNRISAFIDANEVPTARSQSQVVRLGSLTLTDARGNLNQRGQLFESIINERDDLPHNKSQCSTDPFMRGTHTDGRYLVANRLSGQSIRVAQLLQNDHQSAEGWRCLLPRQPLRIRDTSTSVDQLLKEISARSNSVRIISN